MASAPTLPHESPSEQSSAQPKSREEMLEIFRAAREWYQATFPGRDLEAELIAERRAEAAAEQDSYCLKSREEMLAIIRAARAEVQAANPTGRDILEEFLAERRLEAERE